MHASQSESRCWAQGTAGIGQREEQSMKSVQEAGNGKNYHGGVLEALKDEWSHVKNHEAKNVDVRSPGQ